MFVQCRDVALKNLSQSSVEGELDLYYCYIQTHCQLVYYSCNCNIWFDQSKRKRKRIKDLIDAAEYRASREANINHETPADMDDEVRTSKRQRASEPDEILPLKNVRCSEDMDVPDKTELSPIDRDQAPGSIENRTSNELFPESERLCDLKTVSLDDAVGYLDKVKVRAPYGTRRGLPRQRHTSSGVNHPLKLKITKCQFMVRPAIRIDRPCMTNFMKLYRFIKEIHYRCRKSIHKSSS